MGAIQIAHISDLHFGSAGQTDCWGKLAKYLKDSNEIELILVTGDIVHTPSIEQYTHAAKSLNDIGKQFAICPGNHDRYLFGNKLARPLNWVAQSSKKFKTFQELFRPYMPTVSSPQSFPLSSGNNKWNICVTGADSTNRADVFARGYIDDGQLDALGTLNNTSCQQADLSILLVHHHLMAIPELERRGLRNILDATGMVNSGRFLDIAAFAPVELILHGHQHVRHVARFGSGYEKGEVVIAGAGSATGNHSAKGCCPNDATFNVITLNDDRSVYLESRKYDPGHSWRRIAGTKVKLFSPTGLRRAGFRKRFDRDSSARHTRSKKALYVNLDSDRQHRVTTRYRNWLVENGEWSIPIKTSSKSLSEVYVSFRPEDTNSSENSYGVVDPETWKLECKWQTREERQFSSIQVGYSTYGGTILTDEEMTAHQSSGNHQTDLQQMRLEHVGVVVDQPLQMAEVMVGFPPEFSPHNQPMVYVRPTNGSVEMDPPELRGFVEEVSSGQFRLSVPFPLVNCTYGLAWSPPSGPEPSSLAMRFRKYVQENGNDVAAALANKLDDATMFAEVYLPDVKNGDVTVSRQLAGRFASDEENTENSSGWGDDVPEVIIDPDELSDDEIGFVEIYVPVRHGAERGAGFPWAAFVVGFKMRPKSQNQNSIEIMRLHDKVEIAIMSVLGRFLG